MSDTNTKKPKAKAVKPKTTPKRKPVLKAKTPKSTKKQKTSSTATVVAGPPLSSVDTFSTGTAVEDEYKKLTKLEHVLQRPDTYIGEVKKKVIELWVYNEKEQEMQKENVDVSLGALKVTDEILVNARDVAVKCLETPKAGVVTRIDVKVDVDAGTIEVSDDGPGIPVEKHKDWDDQYIMEGIFGDFMAGSNFGDEKKITGGKNGLGCKLTSAYSTVFYAETRDPVRQLKHTQTWSNNMNDVTKPKITPWKGKSGVTVRFQLDWKRFGMKDIKDGDFLRMVEKRVFDLSASTPDSIKIYYNGKMIQQKSFDKYISLYVGGVKSGGKRAMKTFPNSISDETLANVFPKATAAEKGMMKNIKWDIAVAKSEEGFQAVSFVNGLTTWKNGTHVDYVTTQLVRKIGARVRDILAQKKKDTAVNQRKLPEYIRQYMFLFINATIVDPNFTSQCKEECTTDPKEFGFECDLDEEFIEEIIKKCDLIDAIIRFAEFKAGDVLAKTDGKKVGKLSDIPNFEDAQNAGTRGKSRNCNCLITEGLSAKTFAVSGFSIVGREDWGVWPIKGKFKNTRGVKDTILANTDMYVYLKKIFGLVEGKEYNTQDDMDTLRYQCCMLLTDQDPDGFHIKGLIFNVFADRWPTLLRWPGFLKCFKTPLVRVQKGKESKLFFNNQDFEEWRNSSSNTTGWTAKYLKGLGSNDPKDAKMYFKDREKYIVSYYPENYEETLKLFEEAFGDHADIRKEWLGDSYDPSDTIDQTKTKVSFEDFIRKELVHFFKYSSERAIGSMCDGLKISQRKVLYTCRTKNIIKDVKVFQLAGEIAKTAAYHHGDASLNGTIIGMAQDYPGSNNLNLLVPSGEFGSRTAKGDDASAARYIHTRIDPIVNVLFPKADDPLLQCRQDDDGNPVEPLFFVPIAPIILINGCDGTGSGFSTTVPSHNPADVLENLRLKLADKPLKPMHPWYKGYKGTIEMLESNRYISKGSYKILDSTKIQITELPIGAGRDTKGFKAYLDFLESMEINPTEKDEKKRAKMFLKEVKNDYTRDECDFTITFPDRAYIDKLNSSSLDDSVTGDEPKKKKKKTNGFSHLRTLSEWEAEPEEFEKRFCLSAHINLTNMYLFDENDKMEKYASAEDIFNKYYEVRLALYGKRRQYYLKELQSDIDKLKEKIRFLSLIMDRKLEIYRVDHDIIVAKLKELKFRVFDDDQDYDYLLKQFVDGFTTGKLQKLNDDLSKKEQEYSVLFKKSSKQMWLEELDQLEEHLGKWEKRRLEEKAELAKLDEPDENGPNGPKKKKAKRAAK